MKKSFIASVILSVIFGISIAWIDSRPTWDDTAITVFMVLITAFACGFIASRKPWLIALLVSIWIPLAGIILTQNAGGILALVPAFAGAYAGYWFKQIITKP